eukprot:TRINITY_DN10265_c3_g1_i1.p1 TRINITY_DN10265_c3_g1~~TRINITY_DN10265_c3_g1_i1.p1  ORF type:complete len:309 (+),score=19.36 TRINITY_DN10265_c3_g1_i1:142-1068(+)
MNLSDNVSDTTVFNNEVSWKDQKHTEVVDANANYYDMLQVDITSSQIELRRAFYISGKRFNPEVYSENEIISQRFERIGKAFQILSDPKLRQMYDQNGINSEIEQVKDFENSLCLYNAMFGSIRLADLIGVMVPTDDRVEVIGIKNIVQTLVQLLSAYQEARWERFQEMIEAKAEWWCEASYGEVMLLDIAHVYEKQALQYMGFIARMSSRLQRTWPYVKDKREQSLRLRSCAYKKLQQYGPIIEQEWQNSFYVVERTIQDACQQAFGARIDGDVFAYQSKTRIWAKGLLAISRIFRRTAHNYILKNG